jgi:hypothetical protein
MLKRLPMKRFVQNVPLAFMQFLNLYQHLGWCLVKILKIRQVTIEDQI